MSDEMCTHETRQGSVVTIVTKPKLGCPFCREASLVARCEKAERDRDEAISARDAWAHQCNMASEFQADTARRLSEVYKERDTALAEVQKLKELTKALVLRVYGSAAKSAEVSFTVNDLKRAEQTHLSTEHDGHRIRLMVTRDT